MLWTRLRAPGHRPARSTSLMTTRTFAGALTSLALARGAPAFDVRAHGAKGDGLHLDTAAIQSAADR